MAVGLLGNKIVSKVRKKWREKQEKKALPILTALVNNSLLVNNSFNLNPESEINPELVKTILECETPFNGANYTICDKFFTNCYDISYYPETKTFIFTDDRYCTLLKNNDLFIEEVSKSLNVEPTKGAQELTRYFADKTILIQQTGVEGVVYKLGTAFQTAGSASMVASTLTAAKAMGVTGLKLIKTQPLMVITLPTVGAMFFHGFGAVVGNNTVGRTCNTIGNVLNIPMLFAESVYNVYLGPVVFKLTGLTTVLNYTQQALRGPGLSVEETMQLIGNNQNTSIWKPIKCYIIKWLGGKC